MPETGEAEKIESSIEEACDAVSKQINTIKEIKLLQPFPTHPKP